MEFNEYELQLVLRRRLEELRTAAAQRALIATFTRHDAGATLRARLGRALVRLGRLIEGRSPAHPGHSPAAAR